MIDRLLFRYKSRWRNLRYHFRNAPWDDIYAFQAQLGRGKILPLLDIISASWRHGAGFEDYYLMRFFEKSEEERRNHLTLSRLYELERQQHDLEKAQILRDKALFAKHFATMLGRESWTWQELLELPDDGTPPYKMVIKSRFGVRGRDMDFPEQPFSTWKDLRAYMSQKFADPEKYLCEEYIVQHHSLMELNPGTVNTIRIMTYCRGDEVQNWGTFLRIGRGIGPDNFAKGGIAAWIDDDGTIRRKGFQKDLSLPLRTHHPDSGKPIVGFVVPQLSAAKDLVTRAALALPGVATVGWDIVVKADGSLCLLEGNDRWSSIVLQMTSGKTCRHLVEAVCDLSLVYR